MRLFISYSTGDLKIVKQIADAMRPHAAVFYWDKDKEPGKAAWQTIFGWIDAADIVVAVITDKTVSRAMLVGQEIGRAKANRKMIIPLVARGIPDSDLGCLAGITYLRISKNTVPAAIEELECIIEETKIKRADAQTKFWIGLGVIVLIAAAFGEK